MFYPRACATVAFRAKYRQMKH